MRNKNIKEIISVIGIGLFAFLFLIMDGKNIPVLKNFTAPYSVFEFDQVRNQESLQEHHIGKDKKKVVLLGSCMMGTIHCVADHRGNDTYQECALSDLLEQIIFRERLQEWRVTNLSLPAMTIGHSLNIFLQTLENPTFKVFLWENDYKHNDSIFAQPNERLMTYLPFLYQKLLFYEKDSPEIPEIAELKTQIEKKYPGLAIPNQPFLNKWEQSNESFLRGTFNNLKDFFSSVIKRDFGSVLRDINQNTNYLRQINSLLYKLTSIPIPSNAYQAHFDSIQNSTRAYTPALYGIYEKRENAEDQTGQIIALRIMAKLAKKYNKKLYFYLGPNAICEKDQFFTKNFVVPLLKGISDLNSFPLFDLRQVKMEPRVDTFNCINFSVKGKMKLAHEIFKKLKENGDI